MRQIVSGLRYEIRAMVRRPGWAIAAILVLGLGIGANTAIFAAIQSLILRPLPYDRGDRMVYVWQTARRGGLMINPGASLLGALQERATTLEWVEPYQAFAGTLLEGGDPALVHGVGVSPSLFGALGVRPAMGRAFTDADVDGAPVAILSHASWRTRFGGDPAVVGRVMRLDDGHRTIVGVMPADFPFIRPSTDAEFWVPRSSGRVTSDDGPMFAVALLRDGVTLDAARAEFDAMAQGLGEVDPDLAGWSPTLVPPAEMTSDEIRTAVLVVQGAVALVLLIACGNVANLLLARGLRRRRELTIRAALGAGRFELACQLVVHGLVLGLGGGAVGLLLAWWGVDVIKGIRPDSLAALDGLTMNSTLYGFALLLAVATGVGVGLAPALRSTRIDIAESLKQAGPAGGDGRHAWLRGGLVGAQLAFSLVLLSAGALLVRSFAHLIHRDPGFDAEGLLAVTIEPPRARYATMADDIAFFEQLADRLRRDPRVIGASVAGGLPPETGITFGAIHVEGRDEPLGAGGDVRALVRADHEYFRVMRIAIVEGRPFDQGDADGDPVTIVNERMAREYFPDGGALGNRLRFGGGDEWHRIVGVAADVRQLGLKSLSHQLYFPARRSGGFGPSTVVLRAAGDPVVLVDAVRAAVRAIDPQLPIRSIARADNLLAGSVARERFLASLLASLGGAALILSLIGVYGVVAHAVEQRLREIGIRRAVGAAHADLVRFVARRCAWPIAVGLTAGVCGAIVSGRVLPSLLHGVGPNDPVSLALATSLLAGAALAAHALPMRWAVNVDPMTVLREE